VADCGRARSIAADRCRGLSHDSDKASVGQSAASRYHGRWAVDARSSPLKGGL
ncbi:MAG: hypothetical protein AVDCRST_MAG49-2664, partial [uncultured Thermomicrobiales bacterium]